MSNFYLMRRTLVRSTLLAVMMLFTVGVCHAQEYRTAKITINVEDKSIKDLLNIISINADVKFFYSHEQIDVQKKISFQVKDMELYKVLRKIFPDESIQFKFENNKVILIEKFKSLDKVATKTVICEGVVVDKDKSPIVGATIIVPGTSSGAITDEKGKFKISVNIGTRLEISCVGLKTMSYTVPSSASNVAITMEHDQLEVDDVVVTGYQVIDKRMLTSSVETIKAEDMDRMGALTVDGMLEGKVAGLMVTNVSATPGAASKVRVRSGGTFTGSRAPLWVVDGMIYEDPVPLSAEDINSFDNVNLIGNALTGLNPQDIESINVLKDASATAIYGTRAANGVIVVTTKRGKVGKASISYSGTVGFTDRPHYSNFNLMNSQERIEVSRDIYTNSLPYPQEIGSYVGYEGALRDYKLGIINFHEFQSQVNSLEQMNTDWFGALYRPAVSNSHTINTSGGSDNVKYYFSVGYNDDMGTEKGVSLNRITARTNLDIKLHPTVNLSFGMSGSSQEAKYNHNSIKLFNEAYYNSRAVPVKNDDGSNFFVDKKINSDRSIFAGYNILNEMEQSENNIDNNDFNINAKLSWDIVKGITLRASTSYRNSTNITEEWITDKSFYVAKLRTYQNVEDKIDEIIKGDAMMGPFGGLYTSGHTAQKSLMAQAQLNLAKSFNNAHFFNMNIGYEVNTTKYKGVSGWEAPGYNHEQGRSFIKLPAFTVDRETGDIIGYNYAKMLSWLTESVGSGSNNDIYPAITDRISNSLSAFMIFTYSYSNRYIFNFNMRSDGSNKFGQYEKYKFKPTWSVSGRWNIHNEKFMSKVNGLEELALKVSFGFRGTPPSGTPYMVIRNYTENPNVGNEYTATMESFPNSNLTWEKTSTLNLGLSHSWLKGRLSGSFDLAYSKGTDLLLSRPVSLANGQSTQLYNGGSKEDYSYELSLRGVILQKKDVGLSLGVNFTHLREKVLSGFVSANTTYSIDNYLQGNIYLTGFPVDAFYSYKFNGLNDRGLPTFAEINKAPKSGSVAEYFSNCLEYSGSRTPKYYGGINAEFRYKAFSLRGSFSYKFGYSIRRLALYDGTQNMPMPYENLSSELVNRWRKSGDENHTSIPALSNEQLRVSTVQNSSIPVWNTNIAGSNGSKTGWNMYDLSNERVVNGSHIRINNITLSYGVPSDVLSKWKINQLRFSLQASNLGVIVFDKDLKGQDPEQVKGVGMPALPTYTFSISFGF